MTFKDLVIKSHPMGSRYVCSPPVLDTDRDTVILVRDISQAEQVLFEEGWTPCCNGEYVDGYFKAYRKGEDNYVITAHECFFLKYVVGANIAKALNVKDKETRIKIHTAALESSEGFVGLIDWDLSEIIWKVFE